MATITKPEEFDAWVKSRELNVLVQQEVLSEKFRLCPDLKYQMQKTCRSIMDNLAEGLGRKGNLEFIHFISVALGSLYELKSDNYFCSDLNLFSNEISKKAIILVNEVGKLSNGMLRHLKKTTFKGSKFNHTDKKNNGKF